MKSNEVADESYSINGFKHFSDLAVAYFPQMASTSSASKKMRNCIKASNALSEQLADAHYTDTTIEISPHPNNTSLHIRVVEYDKWVGLPDAGKQKKKAVNEKFQLFWNEYHSITQLPKENIAKAQREWKKLSDKEQQLAIDNIEVYYFHQTNVNFLLHAGSYLSNKAFLNEYTY